MASGVCDKEDLLGDLCHYLGGDSGLDQVVGNGEIPDFLE